MGSISVFLSILVHQYSFDSSLSPPTHSKMLGGCLLFPMGGTHSGGAGMAVFYQNCRKPSATCPVKIPHISGKADQEVQVYRALNKVPPVILIISSVFYGGKFPYFLQGKATYSQMHKCNQWSKAS